MRGFSQTTVDAGKVNTRVMQLVFVVCVLPGTEQGQHAPGVDAASFWKNIWADDKKGYPPRKKTLARRGTLFLVHRGVFGVHVVVGIKPTA